MTDKETNNTGSHPTRRGVLRSVGGIGILGSVGDILGDSIGSLVPVNVGYRDKSGFEAATNLADNVVRTFDFDAATISVPGKLLSNAGIGVLASEESIRYVEFDQTMAALGQRVPWGVNRIDADKAHDQDVSGSGIDIAILDTGIDSTHPDLQANLGSGVSFTKTLGLLSASQKQSGTARASEGTHSSSGHNQSESSRGDGSRALGLFTDSKSPEWQDETGHGTHCAGTVGAIDNSEGVVGVSPESTLHAVGVLSSAGFGSASDISAGINHVAKQGWDVANLSLGALQESKLVRDACLHAVEKGTLLVAAAGNGGPCNDCVKYPAVYPEVVGVGATTQNDKLLSRSSTGPEIDLVAPGEKIRSTYSADGQAYATFSGTSMASPHVAGAGGLLMAQGYDNTEAAARLTETAEDIGLSKTDGGAGLLDVPAALGL